MVKTLCQTVEQPASLSLIVPPATWRVRACRLQPVMIKPRLASRPLLQPALPSPLTCPARLLHLWPDPPSLLSCLLLFEKYLLSLRSSTHWGYSNYVECRPFEGLLCKYNHACAWLPIVFAFHPFGCFLCRPPLVAGFPVGQLLCSRWLGKGLAVWKGKYSSFLRL